MSDVDRPQCCSARESCNKDVHSHLQNPGIEGKASADFATLGFDSLEVSEALPGCKSRLVWAHSALDVGARTHFNMEAQFRLNFARDPIRMSPGVKKSNCGFDPGHSYNLLSSRVVPSWSRQPGAPNSAPR